MSDLPTPEPAKELFYNVSLAYHSDEHLLRQIDDGDIILKMIVGVPVRRAEAEKVLVAFSAYTGRTWDLDNVQVVLMPTFAEVHARHHFDLAALAKGAGVSSAVVGTMLAGERVGRYNAHFVLQMASRLTSETYTLETVDIPLFEGGDHATAD